MKGEIKLIEYGEVAKVQVFYSRREMREQMNAINRHYDKMQHKRRYELRIILNTDHINTDEQ